MAGNEGDTDDGSVKSLKISNKSENICYHCSKKMISYSTCAKCGEIFHFSCLVQASKKKSAVCVHEAAKPEEVLNEVNSDLSVENRELKIKNEFLERLLAESQSKNQILLLNNELLIEKINSLQKSYLSTKKPSKITKEQGHVNKNPSMSNIESENVMEKISVEDPQKYQPQLSLVGNIETIKNINEEKENTINPNTDGYANAVLKDINKTPQSPVSIQSKNEWKQQKSRKKSDKTKNHMEPKGKRHFKATTIGTAITGDEGKNQGFTGCEGRVWLFLNRILKHVTCDDILNYIKKEKKF